ncbi:MAG: hypothetical protein KDE08_13275 [Rhodobacteraceae bacterium]|nr:hypothetical protein [Paracoccaceae bacterium]
MGKQPLLHIGYHKTATTWMQQWLFVPEHGYRQIAGHREAFDHVIGPHGLNFDPSAMRAHIDNAMGAVEAGEVPVISSEILSGHPFFGGIDSDVYAHRLKAILPEARILISIRSQLRILPSVYMQYLLRGGTMTPAQFFSGDVELGFFAFRPAHFEYDRLVALYQDLYGAGNVHILTQESLKADMDAAVARLAAYCGNERFAGLTKAARRVHAASYPEHAVPLLRRVNHVQTSVLNRNPIISIGTTPGGFYRLAGGLMKRPPFGPLLSGYRPVTDHVKRHFTGRFSDSNARLRSLVSTDTDLSGYT